MAHLDARPARDAALRNHVVRALERADDRLRRALLHADRASRASALVNRVEEQFAAPPGRAAPVEDVRLVLVAEPAQRAQHRVRRRLPEPAQAGVLNDLRQVLQVHHAAEPLERVELLLVAAGSW